VLIGKAVHCVAPVVDRISFSVIKKEEEKINKTHSKQ
jgi:hypothetical protein